MQTISITITPEDEGKKVRTLLRGKLRFSSHAISGLTRTPTGIRVNGQRAFTTAILHTGDILTAEISDHRPQGLVAAPCDTPLEVVYEDEWLLVVNKPAGMTSLFSLSHPEVPNVPGALVKRCGPEIPFHIVNRLDKGTTGLMVISRTGYTHNLLIRQLHTPEFRREYRAVCMGCPEPEEGSIDLPIGRDESSLVARMIRPDGLPSLTHYAVLQKNGPYTLLQCLPVTGRTHQIRVHLAAVGHPLCGDWLYGTEAPALIARPALHSWRLVLRHPVTGQMLELTAPLPPDMARLME